MSGRGADDWVHEGGMESRNNSVGGCHHEMVVVLAMIVWSAVLVIMSSAGELDASWMPVVCESW
jgi:hypothetical protein